MKILLVAFALTAFNVFALDNLVDMKRMANESINTEMSNLSGHKSCINNAKSVSAFKACKYDMNESQEMQKAEEKEMEKKVDIIDQGATEKKEEVLKNKKSLEESY